MADEWSVDVAERRGDQAAPETGHPPIAAAGRLSPVQRAQRARAEHADRCRQCADIDRQLCATGEQLRQIWTAALDDAYERLHGGRT